MKEIIQLRELLNKPALSLHEVLALMTYARKVMDWTQDDPAFPRLRLYCNWAAHTSITQSSERFKILGALTDIMVEHCTPNSLKAATWGETMLNEINSSLTDGLQTDLNAFLFAHRLPTDLTVSGAKWRNFFALLVEHLKGQPLSFQQGQKLNKTEQKEWDDLRSRLPERKGAIYSIRFVYEPSPRGFLLWTMQISSGDVGLATLNLCASP